MDMLLSIGDKVELTKVKTSIKEKLGEDKHQYTCKIMDIIDEKTVKITIPIIGGKIIPLEIGSKYNVCFFTKKCLCGCEVSLTSRGKENKVYYAIISFLTKLEKIQRREFYRLPLLCNFRIGTETNEEMNWEEATLLDISGGGIKFLSKQKYCEEQVIICKLPVICQEDEDIEVKTKVIASYSHNNDKKVYETRLMFDDIKKQTRENIIRFIFEEERRQRSKRTL